MTTFVDTSAFMTVVDLDELNHGRARRIWEELVAGEEVLVCTNYVVVETVALLQRRIGMLAVKTFTDDILPLIVIEWVDERLHGTGATALLIANRRQLSLVDCVSFEIMRRLGIRSVFTFDSHFREQGFDCLQ